MDINIYQRTICWKIPKTQTGQDKPRPDKATEDGVIHKQEGTTWLEKYCICDIIISFHMASVIYLFKM